MITEEKKEEVLFLNLVNPTENRSAMVKRIEMLRKNKQVIDTTQAYAGDESMKYYDNKRSAETAIHGVLIIGGLVVCAAILYGLYQLCIMIGIQFIHFFNYMF